MVKVGMNLADVSKQLSASICQDNRPPVPDNQFLRQLVHRLVFLKAAFAKTFSPPGSVPFSAATSSALEAFTCAVTRRPYF